MSLLLTLALLGALHTPQPTHTFTRSQDLSITVLATDGTTLPGASISLCSLDSLKSGPSCISAVTDDQGRASFSAIKASGYSLTAELDGFASTTISPLSIGAEDPIAPDQVMLMLNPVCWDC